MQRHFVAHAATSFAQCDGQGRCGDARATVLADLNEDVAQAPFAVANPGTLTHQPNVLCLRNQVQVSCSKQADVWQLTLPPKSLAILSNQLEAESGDRLSFLFLADQDYKRIQYG